MLVLSRRTNESIVIAGNIKVTVLEIRGDHIRIGIDAPREITVHREEIHAELARSNRKAAGTSTGDVTRLPKLPKPGQPGAPGS